ncbi:MAG: OmpA family protein [Chitinophagaceae bacterium]|nr:MAG: OmpA family protein [Chitinophagaceae bacterium]
MTAMNYQNRYFLLTVVLLFSFCVPYAQQAKKETAAEYVARLRNMADSIKSAKQAGKSSGSKSSGGSPVSAGSTGKYNTKKSSIENAYNFLTPEEKEKVKTFPPVPEAFRNNLDAQAFLDKLNGIDFNAAITKYSQGKSAALTGYCIAYQSTRQKAETIVKESVRLKLAFEKLNPNVTFGTNVGKTYVSEATLVYLPLGDASFADEVIAAKYVSGNIQFPKENVLHTPDYVLMKKLSDNKGIYSLGLKGSLTIKFTDNALVDVNGPDLFVFEAGEIEPTTLEISKDGNTWINVGMISGGTAAVDIKTFVQPNEYFYYLRLTDRNTKSTVAGADIDAIATIGAAIKLSLNAAVLFDFGKSELKKEGVAAVHKLAEQLQSIPAAEVNVEGFTDDIGNNESNIKLSLQRAEAVLAVLKQQLQNKTGFNYTATGKGKANPVASNNSEENRQRNRRVEILAHPK